MRIKNFLPAAIAWAAGGTLIAAQMGAPGLFKEVKTDAQQIHSTAVQMEKLTSQPGTKWNQYDSQWNQIKPAQEALEIHLRALQAKENAMSPAARKAVDESKAEVQRIAERTHELRAMLDKPGVDLKSPKLHQYARDLAIESAQLTRLAAANHS